MILTTGMSFRQPEDLGSLFWKVASDSLARGNCWKWGTILLQVLQTLELERLRDVNGSYGYSEKSRRVIKKDEEHLQRAFCRNKRVESRCSNN